MKLKYYLVIIFMILSLGFQNTFCLETVKKVNIIAELCWYEGIKGDLLIIPFNHIYVCPYIFGIGFWGGLGIHGGYIYKLNDYNSIYLGVGIENIAGAFGLTYDDVAYYANIGLTRLLINRTFVFNLKGGKFKNGKNDFVISDKYLIGFGIGKVF